MNIRPVIITTLLINLLAIDTLPSGAIAYTDKQNKLNSKTIVSSENSDESSTGTTDNIKELIQDADTALNDNSLTEAITKYNSVISRFSGSIDNQNLTHCYKKIGIANTLLKNFDEAIKNFNLALKLNEDKTDTDSILNTVTVKYSLARAFESKGDIKNAIVVSQSALDLAKEKLSDSPYLIRRLIALKSQLYFSHIAQKLEVDQEQKNEEPEHPKEYTLDKPLVGKVSSQDYFKAKSLMSEVPALDTSHLKNKPLKAQTKKTVLFSGTKKVKNKLTKKLMEYGTMGVSLKKDVPGFPWYVRYVLRGGAGSRYGVQKKDIVNSIDGHPIKTLPITTIYHMFCGRRGEVRTLGITRNGKKMYLRLRLISVYEIDYAPSEYIEYYWFLLYNGYITNKQYARLAKPYEKYLH